MRLAADWVISNQIAIRGMRGERSNAWDCVAAMLVIEEAGGIVEPFNAATSSEMAPSGSATACSVKSAKCPPTMAR
jgi:fructose-1,6-bisphosphatase/inositol monophosphatase family enzyme